MAKKIVKRVSGKNMAIIYIPVALAVFVLVVMVAITIRQMYFGYNY